MSILFLSAFLLLSHFGEATVKMTLVNKCPHPIWPALHGRPLPALNGFKLDAGKPRTVEVADNWVAGRIWARTGCSGNEGSSFHCQTGNCGNKVACEGRTGEIPASLAEFTLNGAMGDFYDVSFVDGSNVRMTIKPVDGTFEKRGGHQYDCAVAGKCSRDLKDVVVEELKYRVNGQVVGTKSACSATNDPKFCCSGAHNRPETCPKSNFPAKFYGDLKKICPTTYLYAYDDHSSTFTCKGKNNHSPEYVITFCSD